MAEEDLVTSAPGSPTVAAETHKRKLDDLELSNAAPEPVTESEPVSDPDSAADDAADGEDNGGEADESDAKRPRLETSNGDDTVNEADAAAAAEVSQNGHEEQKADHTEEEAAEQQEPVEDNSVPSEADEPTKEHAEVVADEPVKEHVELTGEEPATIDEENSDTTAADNAEEPKEGRVDEPSQEKAKTEAEIGVSSDEQPREGDVPVSLTDLQPGSGTQVFSRNIQVPNDKVGVLIGKAGDTIRSLQDNSGAKIQIVRDADADPQAVTRPLELVGTLRSINKAEKLIKDVIAEADAGGAPSLVARGFTTAQAASTGDQVEIQVPYEKVGLIIGKGGESIRNLQTRSGARIQLIQSPSDGNRSGERTVRITGHKKAIESAREMIKDVMNQTIRPSQLSGGYNQQGFRPRGPNSPQWGPRGPQPPFPGYNNYPRRGPYSSQGSQYPPAMYGNYPPQHGPRGNFGPNWEQRPPASIHGPSSQGNYNFGQQGPDYGNPPYSQPPAQPYGQGYNEVKYDNHASSQPYGHMGSQPTPYAQGGPHPGYGAQDQYGKPPMHGQPAPSQSYVQPRPAQPAESYQGQIPPQQPFAQIPPQQPFAQNPPPQQSYPHAPSGPMQQNYPYGPTPTTDGYNHPPTTAPTYPAQPVTGYNQPAAQQPGAYPQAGAAGGYGSYPPAQYGYPEQQPAANTAAYGYQGQADPAYGTTAQGPASTYPAPAAGQVGYAQTQPAYDQSGGYGNAPAAPAPTNVSPLPAAATAAAPYPQYDSTGQMYGAHR